MGLLNQFISLVFRVGYFGPFLMGILDSSFLILPFGNDLVVVGLAARNPYGIAGYVLSAALGSTCGALLLALVSRNLGDESLRRLTGKSRFESLIKRIGNRSGFALAVGALSPPPFPYTAVIASVSALKYPIKKMLLINFLARSARFAVLSLLALKFGPQILSLAQSSSFKWTMTAFTFFCIAASAVSIARMLRRAETKPAPAHAVGGPGK